MDNWNDDYINIKEQASIEFLKNGVGDFHFGYVQGRMDSRPSLRGEQESIEFVMGGL